MPKQLRFDVLWLLSEKESRACKVPLAKNTTILVGGNHSGKSTVFRMLFHAFACKIRPLGAEWDPRAVVAVTFSVDEKQFTILRRGSTFSLFNEDGQLLWATKDQSEVRDRFGEAVSFVLPLVSQQGELKQARPAFFFLPWFIDQDGSWGNAWATFDSLGEFREWQKPTLELALGIKGSDFWTAFAQLSIAKKRVEDLAREAKILDDTRKRLSTKFPKQAWFRDALSFRQDLSELEVKASHLENEQRQLEAARLDSVNAEVAIKVQLGLIEAALREHAEDMRFLDDRRINGELLCPTCGTSHENSFHSRLNLEAEADDLRQLRTHFEIKLERIQKQAAKDRETLDRVIRECDEVDAVLNRHRGELRLREIVNRAGANTAHEALDDQARTVTDELNHAEGEVARLQTSLDALDDPGRAKEVAARFREFYNHFATTLSVPASLVSHSRAITQKPNAGGSGGPRAVLAYYFALAHVAQEFSQGCIPPLCVDSPHQQAQDEIRRPKVTEFIAANRPSQQQLIVGLEDPPPDTVKLGPNDVRIDLTQQFGLLTADAYPEVFSFIEPKWHSTEALLSSLETDPAEGL